MKQSINSRIKREQREALYVDYSKDSIGEYVKEFKKNLIGYNIIPSTSTATAYYYLMGGEVWKRFLKKIIFPCPRKIEGKYEF